MYQRLSFSVIEFSRPVNEFNIYVLFCESVENKPLHFCSLYKSNEPNSHIAYYSKSVFVNKIMQSASLTENIVRELSL